VEVAAHRLDRQIEEVGGALRFGWMKAVGGAASFLGGLWGAHKKENPEKKFD
jgi:hypothetical protein